MEFGPRCALMMADNITEDDLVKKKKAFEDALQLHDNKVGILEDYEEDPEGCRRAKRAMLHCVCLGMDTTTKKFRREVKRLVNEKEDIPYHDDVYKFEENQDCIDGGEISNGKGKDIADSVPRDCGTRDKEKSNISDRQTNPPQTENKVTENTGQEPQDTTEEQMGNLDDLRYSIGSKRLAVYIGIGKFEKRVTGSSDLPGGYDDKLDRIAEVRMDKINARYALEKLNFTFMSNEESETCKKKVDKFITTALKKATDLKVDIIVVLISSHGEEVKEQDETNKNKNILRHRVLLEDEHLYTDELLNQFNRSALKGIPKLFFIQACRSNEDAVGEDFRDTGVIIPVQGSMNSELKKELIESGSDGKRPRDISDARPRNLKPKVMTEPQKEDNVPATAVPVRPSPAIPPGGMMVKENDDVLPSHQDISEARPKNLNSATTASVKNNGDEAKPPSDITCTRAIPWEIQYTVPQGTDPLKDNSDVKKTTDLAEVRPPLKPVVDTTVSVDVPQEDTPAITCIEDSLVMFASAPGKEAYRRRSVGGWMMQAVVKGLENWPENPDQDLLQVLTGVIGKIAIENETEEGYKSAACLTHMLTKDIYLC